MGLENLKQVHNLCLRIRIPAQPPAIGFYSDLPSWKEYDNVSSWIAALEASTLTHIVRLSIEAELVNSDPLHVLFMPRDLEESIKQFLGRRAPDKKIPRLELKGLREQGREKFPEGWEVVMDQWDCYKPEMEWQQRDWETMQKDVQFAQWTFHDGSSGGGEDLDGES
ncbi:hypothetical protein BCR34DRAFT_132923 [Clohesyomyces aquaticus]|uniref:Uncharacterized protein n=1 Tax=Clohesyomyces aquaticus TaxID=1231657 RepID=A0A1Y2AB54_9PLEO|nr:hypothetical protein BCR34DRAFT_132923 [Clohesyomyces aquaticus]